MSDRERLESELEKTMSDLESVNAMDVTLNETSVVQCGLMAKYWSLKLQLAEDDCSAESDRQRVKGEHMVEVASRHLAEWEKRKAAAWEKRRLDELPRLAAKIEEFRKAGSLLAGLD